MHLLCCQMAISMNTKEEIIADNGTYNFVAFMHQLGLTLDAVTK